MSQTNTLIAISIHSLVKRETQWQHEPCLYGWHFNPLPRKEGDHRSQRVPCPVGDFNPLPRKEGDQAADMSLALFVDFNPLPRKEGDGV